MQGIDRYDTRLALRLLVLGAAFTLVLAAPWRASPVGAADLPEVQTIEIVGAQVLSEGELRGLLRTRGPSFWRPFSSTPYRRDILLRDLERIESRYRDEGYLEAVAELTEVTTLPSGAVSIVITVTEGQPTVVEWVEIEGYRSLRRDAILEVIGTKAGDRFSPSRMAVDRQAIFELYADYGRPYSTVVDSVRIEDRRARVLFGIREAPVTRIGHLSVDGTRATKGYVVRRELTLGSGDLLRRSRVLESRERLLQTGFFRDVRFKAVIVDSSLAPEMVDLRLQVAERKMGWVESGIGYNSSKQLRLAGEVGHRNVLGNAHRLELRARVGFDLDAIFLGRGKAVEENRIEIAFREPWLFSRRNVGSIRLFTELNSVPELTTPDGVRNEEFRGVALAIERGFNTPFRFNTAFENRWTTQEVIVDIDPELPDSLIIEERRFVTNSLSVFAQRDYRDNPFDPSRGTLANVLARYAGGDSDFIKLSASSSWYRRLRRRIVVAARVRVGWIHVLDRVSPDRSPADFVPRNERFSAGGATSVRGYPEDSLGPQQITDGQRGPATDRGLFTVVTNLEMRFPLFSRLGGAVFLDGGNVWESVDDFNFSNFVPESDPGLEKYRYSFGGGVRLSTPIGPLRVDYGYGLVRGEPERELAALRNGEWHFSLGQAF